MKWDVMNFHAKHTRRDCSGFLEKKSPNGYCQFSTFLECTLLVLLWIKTAPVAIERKAVKIVACLSAWYDKKLHLNPTICSPRKTRLQFWSFWRQRRRLLLNVQNPWTRGGTFQTFGWVPFAVELEKKATCVSAWSPGAIIINSPV